MWGKWGKTRELEFSDGIELELVAVSLAFNISWNCNSHGGHTLDLQLMLSWLEYENIFPYAWYPLSVIFGCFLYDDENDDESDLFIHSPWWQTEAFVWEKCSLLFMAWPFWSLMFCLFILLCINCKRLCGNGCMDLGLNLWSCSFLF